MSMACEDVKKASPWLVAVRLSRDKSVRGNKSRGGGGVNRLLEPVRVLPSLSSSVLSARFCRAVVPKSRVGGVGHEKEGTLSEAVPYRPRGFRSLFLDTTRDSCLDACRATPMDRTAISTGMSEDSARCFDGNSHGERRRRAASQPNRS